MAEPEQEVTNAAPEEGEEEEVFASNMGTAEEQEFDRLIGIIEDVMMSDALTNYRLHYFKKLPKLEETTSSHEQYVLYKKYLEGVEELFEAAILSAVPDKSVKEIGDLIQSRSEEVSEDVLELVTGCTVDFETFVELWKASDTA